MSKASNLVKLENSNLPIPRFVILTNYDIMNYHVLDELVEFKFQVKYAIRLPHKVSVRSSGSVSAPGRMKTLLNVTVDNLNNSILEVYDSTKSQKLLDYLNLKGIKSFTSEIIVQEMVQGDFNGRSCSGVLTTVNPFGKSEKYIEFLWEKRGDNLMSGRDIPLNEDDLIKGNPIGHNRLMILVNDIKKIFREPQEIEFVIQDTIPYILQTRDYKGVSSTSFENLKGLKNPVGQGMSVNLIGCQGTVTFDKNKINEDSILICDETDWEDTSTILKARGVITLKGGRLSHTSIIATEFNLPCVVGTNFNEKLNEGDKILFTGKGTIFKI